MLLPLARRALAGAAVVAGVVALTFVLLRLAPGDPVEQLVGPAATPEQTALQRHALGLDRPLPAQFAAWFGRFAREPAEPGGELRGQGPVEAQGVALQRGLFGRGGGSDQLFHRVAGREP